MRRAAALALLIFALAALFGAAWADKPVLEYYYENYCESCRPDEDFAEEFRTLTADDVEHWTYRTYNLVTSSGRAAYNEMLSRLHLESRQGSLPVAVLDGHAFIGTAEIAERLPEYAVRRLHSRDSVLYCLNADESVRAMLDELPETIRVTLGRYSFDSPLRVECAEGEQARALAEKWGLDSLPEDPVVLAGSETYIGQEEIRRLLQFRLPGGAALAPIVSQSPPSEKALPLGALCAGLLCAAAAGLLLRRARRRRA